MAETKEERQIKEAFIDGYLSAWDFANGTHDDDGVGRSLAEEAWRDENGPWPCTCGAQFAKMFSRRAHARTCASYEPDEVDPRNSQAEDVFSMLDSVIRVAQRSRGHR